MADDRARAIGDARRRNHERRGPLTPLQMHFLRRLAYLTALKNVLYASPSVDWKKVELVLRAKASTLRDCFDQGVGDLAIDIEILLKSQTPEEAAANETAPIDPATAADEMDLDPA